MKKFTYLLLFVLVNTAFLQGFAQTSTGCEGNLLSDVSNYYGGFESGSKNFTSTTGSTEYSYGLPKNGHYEIVNNAKKATGGGYLDIQPKSGEWLMVAHMRTTTNEKIWHKTITVTAGQTYRFCAWIANAKAEPVSGFTVQLKVNNTVIASAMAKYGWSQICGTYTVPEGVTSMQISISDPNGNVNPSHFLALDDICLTRTTAAVNTLGNLIWNDINGNGVKDTDEPGIGGATVSLYRDNNNDNLPDGAAIATTTTNTQGSYSFTGLIDGRYIVSIPILPGYRPSPIITSSSNPDNNTDNDNNGVRQASGSLFSNAITLAAGTEPGGNTNNTLDLALCGNGVIGDLIFNDSNSNGVQDAGETGISGATVTIRFADGTTKTVTTGNGGSYQFINLGPGTYTLTFNTPAGLSPSPANQGNDDNKDSDPVNGTVTVTLAANQSNLTIDAGFFAGSGNLTLGNLVWNDVNGNGIKEADEAGIGGVTVKLYRDNDGNNLPDNSTAINTTTTNAQGIYTFTGLASGKYMVGLIIPAGYITSPTNSTNPDNNIDNDNNGVTVVNSNEYRSNHITLATGTEPTNDGDDSNGNLTLDLALCGRSDIGDFVFNDINNNGIQDAGEQGIAGVRVTLTYPDGTTTSTTTNTNGLYKFVNLGPGSHTVTFETPSGFNPSPANQGSDDAKDSDPVNGSVTVQVMVNVNNFTIDAGFNAGNLTLGNFVWNDTDGDGRKDDNETGIGGVTVSLYRDANSDNLPDGAAIATTQTNTQGFYQFTGLANGRYIASIPVLPGYNLGGRTATSATPDNDVDTDNNAVNRVDDVVFTNAITLMSGTEPTNDGDGTNGNLTLDLALCGNGYIGDFVFNDLNRNGIQDADEPGIAGATVTLTFPSGSTRTEVTNADGIYYFPNLGPGTYTVTFTTPQNFTPSPANQGGVDSIDSDPVNGSVTVTLAANQSDFTIDAGFYVATTPLCLGNLVFNDVNNNGVKDANESGIRGVTVRLYADNNGDNLADGSAIATQTTGTDGSYLFTNLPNGKYIVGVVLPSGYTAGATTTGSASPDNNIDNDNNGVTVVNGEVRSNFITLAAGTEPTNDGDGTNGNLTLDFGLKVSSTGCPDNLVSNNGGYYGGFEAGGNNISLTTGGSDLYNGLPRNGSYQIVNDVDELGGGGYLDIKSKSGNYFLAAHTSNRVADRIWYSRVNVTPGTTYQFCTNVTLLKNLGSGANFVLGLYVNGVSIGTGRVTFDWTQICGSYTVPAGVTSIELSIRDPKKGLFFVAIDDICFTPTGGSKGSIGDFVFNDINKNGIQDAGEGGINNVTVTLTSNTGETRTTLTNANGYYQFTNVGNGSYTVTFSAPSGFTPSPANQGSDDTKDSDPVNGSVSVNVSNNLPNNTIDAGFYRNECVPVQSSTCPAGFSLKVTNFVKNGNFGSSVSTPAPGNTYAGTTNADAGTSYMTSDGSTFRSQADYRGTGYADQINGTENAFSIITSTGAYTATYANEGTVNQLPFPGDAVRGVPASNSFMFWNGVQFASKLNLVWEQNITGLTIGQTYTFRFYASNLMEPVNGQDDFHDPLLVVNLGGTQGMVDGTHVFPTGADWYQLTKSESANSTSLNGWKRFEITFTATSVSQIIKILDCARGSKGDLLGLTGIAIETCVKATTDPCIGDLDDIDDDNDGITDLDENGGIDADGDCDGDGIPNSTDQTPGCQGLTFNDCPMPGFPNGDGINDFFDFDRDGIINSLDLDSDNDGILDVQEARDPRMVDDNGDGMVDGVDNDGDGLLSTADTDDNTYGGPGLRPEDLDRDGNPNYLDLDSDGDGITDITEALEAFDADGLTNGTDTDGDGVRENGGFNSNPNNADNINGFGARGIIVKDRDGDGIPNPYDIDSDNDGITDNVEGQPTCSYVVPSGNDDDKDGVDNSYDIDNNTCPRRAPGINPFDKDGDGTPDIYDLDTDNDLALDVNEGSGIAGNFVELTTDADGDGLVDQFDNFNIKTATGIYYHNVVHSQMGPNGSFDGPVPGGSGAQLPKSQVGGCPEGVDRDWRNVQLLPVTLLQFNGNLDNGRVKLNWIVANEVNMAHYIVERSLDGVTFTSIGQVRALGNQVATSYSLFDNVADVNTTTVYYRLVQVGKDNTNKLSNVITFKLQNRAVTNMSVYPNPAKSFFVVKVNAQKDGNASIRVMDVAGRVVMQQNNKVVTGSNAITFNNIANIAAGTYNVQVMLNGEVMNEKVMIVK